jgi:hypothetical protein
VGTKFLKVDGLGTMRREGSGFMTPVTRDTDYASWYAALTVYNDEGAYSWRLISYSSERVDVFNQIAELLTSCYEDIFIPYDADYLNVSEIAQVFDEYFPERAKPEDGWSHWDLIPLLKDLEQEARREIGEFEGSIRDTRWHWLIRRMSEAISPKNYGLVLLEGTVPAFARKLLVHYAADRRRGGFVAVSSWDAEFLGELFILARLRPWEWKGGRTAAFTLFAGLVGRYNEKYDG